MRPEMSREAGGNIDIRRVRALQRSANAAHAAVTDADRQQREAYEAVQTLESTVASKRREAAERPQYHYPGRRAAYRDLVADLEIELEEARAELRERRDEYARAAGIWRARRRLADSVLRFARPRCTPGTFDDFATRHEVRA